MRIPKEWLPSLSREITNSLVAKNLIELKLSKEQLTALIGELLLEELMVEDRLNEEVREMLKKYDSEIETGRLDYRRLFDMTKQKLVRDRNIII
jgi:hypothetical protein